MIVLKDTTDSIELFLDGAVTTNEVDVMVSYDDVVGSVEDEGRQMSYSNGTTPETICDSPDAGTQRYIDYISIFNSDTANVIINIRYKNNTQYYSLKKVELLPNETLEYLSLNGWVVK